MGEPNGRPKVGMCGTETCDVLFLFCISIIDRVRVYQEESINGSANTTIMLQADISSSGSPSELSTNSIQKSLIAGTYYVYKLISEPSENTPHRRPHGARQEGSSGQRSTPSPDTS